MRLSSARFLLPIVGAIGFITFGELSLSQSRTFLLWSLATMAWILGVFVALAVGRLKGRLMGVAVPAVLMISISTVASLMFLDLVSPRHGFILFFAIILYLFLEHVRHETDHSSPEERLFIAEYARMVNVGSFFLVLTGLSGFSVFLPVSPWLTFLGAALAAVLWSWHLYAACIGDGIRSWTRTLLTALVVAEAYAVVARLPLTMFVAAALVTVVYYEAPTFLAVGTSHEMMPIRILRRQVGAGLIMAVALLLTARWIQ